MKQKQILYEKLIQYILENQDRFYRVAYSYTRHQEDALDVVQSAVCKALEAYESIQNEDAVKTWFYKILINECLAVLKKRKRLLLSDESSEREEAYFENKALSWPKTVEREYSGGGFMSKLDIMKERYDRIAIPEELNTRIAGVCVLFIAALNVSPVFAQEAEQLPMIGGLARILTFRTYETEKDDIAVSVEIPTIEVIAADTGIAVDEINQEIFDRCNQYAAEALQRAEEYRTAFLETGGTPEEWAEHKIKITVGYEIKQQNNDYLSFVVRGTENWANAYNESRYYNMDLRTGEMVTLKDMLGDDYEELVNESIREQITEREKAGEVFFSAEEGGFAGISEDVKFYINENNRPVIVFGKYEIAPGSSGEIAFEIKEISHDSAAEMTETNDADEAAQTPQMYEDNFAVDSKAAREFAKKIQEAAAQKDLEALAELTAFPVYVGLPDVGVVETKEEFLRLGAEAVFTDELLESVKNADIDHFQPSMAGFSISDGGAANINFGVLDGVLAINGINY